MTHQITGALYKSMIMNGAAAIDSHKGEINELNVFPVPDGDTGTNMSLTMGAGATALSDASPGTIGRASELTANALLRGARGNSGVILSLLFRGVARHLKSLDTANASELATALSSGVDSAYKAIMKPTEGTILTVSRIAAEAAISHAIQTDDIEAVLEHALKVGYEALDNTINQNPVLKRAGVVDAGGKGYLYIIEGMLKALKGEVIAYDQNTAVGAEKADFSSFDTQDIRFTYCTEFIVSRKTGKDVNHLRDFLDERGDSIVVVDDEEIIKVHVHSNEPGVILTEALTYGPLLSVKVENMKEQHTEKLMETEQIETSVSADTQESAPAQTQQPQSDEPSEPDDVIPEIPEPEDNNSYKAEPEYASESETYAGDPEPNMSDTVQETAEYEPLPDLPADTAVETETKPIGVVAVCAGEGMCNVFRDLGTDSIIIGGQTMNPSTEDILNQIEATPAETVFILPNNKNIIMAAQQCMSLTEKQIVVIPTKSMPQGISAMIAMDPSASVADNVSLMSEAIERVHTAQITYAARNSEYDGQSITAGDYLALIEDKLVATGKDTTSLVDTVAFTLASYGPEFITVFSGADVDANTADEVIKRLNKAIPEAEFSVIDGGQPVYYFLISAE